NPKPEIRNSEPETRNSKPETRNPKHETRNTKHETRNTEHETRNPKPETRNPTPETRNPNRVTRNPRSGTRKQVEEELAKRRERDKAAQDQEKLFSRKVQPRNPKTPGSEIRNPKPETEMRRSSISSGRVFIMSTILGISDPILVHLKALNEV
ncbi:hypothetical protein T484DRAFT_1630134, partial [Baffinella frigidus]